MKTWLITGASRGLGRAIAEVALRQGDRVAATSRSLESLQKMKEQYDGMLLPLQLEVTDPVSIRVAFQQCIDAFGRIDVLVNNAGYIQLGAMEETTEAEAREQMETLFWGPYHLSRLAVAQMRRQQGGDIVQVSSLGGIGGLPGNTMYAASKYALEGMSEALSREVKSFGIRVILLEPAGIRTSIGTGVKMSQEMEEYRQIVGPQRDRWLEGADSHAAGDPERCAEALLQLLKMENPPLRFLMSAFAAEMGILIHKDRLEEAQRYEQMSRKISVEQRS